MPTDAQIAQFERMSAAAERARSRRDLALDPEDAMAQAITLSKVAAELHANLERCPSSRVRTG